MDQKALLLVSCATATIFLMACGSSYQEPAAPGPTAMRTPITLKIDHERQDTRTAVEADADLAIVQIFSSSGIGSADIEVTSAALPQKILLRFHLRGLEELRFTYGDTSVTAAVSSAGDKTAHQSQLSNGQEHSVSEGSPYWMPIRVVPGAADATLPPQESYIEVEAPADFITRGQRKFSIHWVDFYR
jgi:hypothetical protein